MRPLTVLSFGGGQDSTAILYRMLYNQPFREQYAPGDFVVVMSDTNDEHPETYRHIKEVQATCAEHDVEFHFLTYDKGYHSDTWPGLREFYRRTNTVGSKAFPKTCTDRLKIQPIYRWLSAYVAKKHGWDPAPRGTFRGKWPLVSHAALHGKIKVMIGIAGDEGKRIAGVAKAKWMRRAIERVYPLVDLGWNRQDCQDYIQGLGFTVPLPSNCMLCPFMSPVELLWLYRKYPDAYHDWVKIEAAKLEANKAKGDKNLGVWGRKTLPEILAEAEVTFADWSDEQLTEHRMSHGHCVASRY